jgi:uncharacterized metal-binding protein YceD (DUF177 family)
MHILVSNIKKTNPILIKGSYKNDLYLKEELEDLNFTIDKLDFSCSFERKGDFIELNGLINGSFKLACVRCLENLDYNINEDFKLFLYHDNLKVSSDNNEIELDTKDLDFCFIEGNQIYPAKIIREQLILSLPDYPVCNAKCHCKCKNNSIIDNANLN